MSKMSFIKGRLKGRSPMIRRYIHIIIFPLMIGIYIHIMERGIKGVRLINNL